MLIESAKPLKVKWPTGEIHLAPGVPVEFPLEQAQKLLAKAGGKVRIVHPDRPDWLTAWRDLAALTYGITDKDPRFSSVMAALGECDDAFQRGNWSAFQRAADQVRAVMQS